MHILLSIALGIFAGLWLFVRWLEWRAAVHQAALTRRGMALLYPQRAPAPAQAAMRDRLVPWVLVGAVALVFGWVALVLG